MKRFLQILILIALSNFSFSQENNFLATYKIKYLPINYKLIQKENNLEIDSPSENFIKLKKQLNEEAKSFNKLSFLLEFNKNQSKFYKLPILKNEVTKMQLITIIFGVLDQKYFVNSKTTLEERNSFGQDFLVEMSKIEWKISNDKMKIGKYLCYKATATIIKENSKGKKDLNIVAWFSPKLPFNYGPKNYSGLPGLIIKLEEGKNIVYYFSDYQTNRLPLWNTHKWDM